MLKISFACCIGLSPAISMQFSIEMSVADSNREKKNSLKPLFWGSWSFKVTDVGTRGKLVSCASTATFLKSAPK